MGVGENERLKDTLLVKKPWGHFIQYTHNEVCTVKILTVNPDQMLSEQSHQKRDELWVVLDDGLRVEIDGQQIDPQPYDEIVIPRKAKHRLISLGKKARVLEISFGHFDESDIQRFDDLYDRGQTPEK